MGVNSQGQSTDFNPANIPERWLDLLTGYVELALLIAVLAMGVAALLK